MVKHDHFGLTAERQIDGQVPSSWETGMWRKPSLHQLCFIAFELFNVFVTPPNNKTLSSCTSNPYSLATHNSPQGMVHLLLERAPSHGQVLSIPFSSSPSFCPAARCTIILHSALPSKSSSSLLFSESLDQGGSGWALHLMTTATLPALTSLFALFLPSGKPFLFMDISSTLQTKPWLQWFLVPLTASNMDAGIRSDLPTKSAMILIILPLF